MSENLELTFEEKQRDLKERLKRAKNRAKNDQPVYIRPGVYVTNSFNSSSNRNGVVSKEQTFSHFKKQYEKMVGQNGDFVSEEGLRRIFEASLKSMKNGDIK